jgi:hypothetical protein
MLFALVMMVSNLSNSFTADAVENGSEMQAYIPEYGQIHAADCVLLNTTIGANISSFSFILAWFNATSSLEATLTSPGGVKIDSTAQLPIIYGMNNSLIFYILHSPEAGIWTATITAKNVPDVGETYWAVFNTTSGYESTDQGLINEELNLSDLVNTIAECESCTEQS